MKLDNLAIQTGVMRKGMTVRDFFIEAVRCDVPGLPYEDEQGRIVGRISLRDVYKRMAVTDNLLSFADVIGDQTDSLDLPPMKVMETLALPIETYLIGKAPSASPRSSIVKALVIMEANNSGYVFVIDNGKYIGAVTRRIIAKRMLECVFNHKPKSSAA
ncbi:MAG: CBS domain-containing protein [Gammaproteobacteria bacterium]|jgi:CBS domain-containing protein|nr:CBS domain-containing protein [Gammaproteobacteria bacterium]